MSISPPKALADLPAPRDFGAVEERLRQDFQASGVPSLAVAVARHGGLLWETAFGWAEVKHRVPATTETMYSVASTTKPFTATALMILAERGQIDLDRPVNDYLPADSRLKVWIGNPEDAEWHRPPTMPNQSPDPADPAYRELLGEWRGIVHTHETEMSVVLRFLPFGDIHASLGQQQTTLVNEVEMVDGWLRGAIAGCIETTDAMHHPNHHVRLDLKLRGDRLCGVLIASAGNTLAHWAELRRTSA